MSVSPVAFGPFAASDGSVGDRALALTNYKTHVSACVRPHASQRAERAGDARRWGGKPKALRAFLKKGSQRRRWGPEPPGRRASGAREHTAMASWTQMNKKVPASRARAQPPQHFASHTLAPLCRRNFAHHHSPLSACGPPIASPALARAGHWLMGTDSGLT